MENVLNSEGLGYRLDWRKGLAACVFATVSLYAILAVASALTPVIGTPFIWPPVRLATQEELAHMKIAFHLPVLQQVWPWFIIAGASGLVQGAFWAFALGGKRLALRGVIGGVCAGVMLATLMQLSIPFANQVLIPEYYRFVPYWHYAEFAVMGAVAGGVWSGVVGGKSVVIRGLVAGLAAGLVTAAVVTHGETMALRIPINYKPYFTLISPVSSLLIAQGVATILMATLTRRTPAPPAAPPAQ